MNSNGVEISKEQEKAIHKIKIISIGLDNAVYGIDNAKNQDEVQDWIRVAKCFLENYSLEK